MTYEASYGHHTCNACVFNVRRYLDSAASVYLLKASSVSAFRRCLPLRVRCQKASVYYCIGIEARKCSEKNMYLDSFWDGAGSMWR